MISTDRYSAALLRFRWPVVVLAVLVLLIMASGARVLTVSNDYRILFSEGNPQLLAGRRTAQAGGARIASFPSARAMAANSSRCG